MSVSLIYCIFFELPCKGKFIYNLYWMFPDLTAVTVSSNQKCRMISHIWSEEIQDGI